MMDSGQNVLPYRDREQRLPTRLDRPTFTSTDRSHLKGSPAPINAPTGPRAYVRAQRRLEGANFQQGRIPLSPFLIHSTQYYDFELHEVPRDQPQHRSSDWRVLHQYYQTNPFEVQAKVQYPSQGEKIPPITYASRIIHPNPKPAAVVQQPPSQSREHPIDLTDDDEPQLPSQFRECPIDLTIDDEPYILDFGKYRGLTLAKVQDIDMTYITWLEGTDFSRLREDLAEGLAAHATSDESRVTRRQLLASAGKYPITWGKYAGSNLEKIPNPYRQWLVDENHGGTNMQESLKLMGHRKYEPITSAIPSRWTPPDVKSDAARSFLNDYTRRDEFITPMDAQRFFKLSITYLSRLTRTLNGMLYLFQVYDMLKACEGTRAADGALEDFLENKNDREME